MEDAGIDRDRVLGVDSDKVDNALDVTDLHEQDVYDIDERAYVRKAGIDENVKETRLQGLNPQVVWPGLVNGYGSESGHVVRGSINEWFDALVNESDVIVERKKPLPKIGRPFWYDAYSDVLEEIIAEVGEIAAEQGSSDAGVVLNDDLSPERKRTTRRDGMHRRPERAFDTETSGSTEIEYTTDATER